MSALVCPSCQAEYDEPNLRFCGRCGSDMRRAPDGGAQGADLMIGRVVDGRYRIQSRLGAGGMGAVYKVEHLAMGKLAAMKVLHPALSTDPELGARFRREAEAVSRLSHPNTVQVFDFGQQKGLMYLVMELVKGEDLGQILRRDGPIGWSRARAILIQVCESLAEAHEAGIIHRDLKPENLLISRSRDGRDFVKVLDFGLAKLRDSEEIAQVTARGSLVGTPYYMSPEQIRAEELDPRSDVYSLGALLYRMITGEHPFSASTPLAVLTQHLTDPLIPPSKRRPDLMIDQSVDIIVRNAMAKDKNTRYGSVDELRRALEHAPSLTSPSQESLPGKRRESDRIDPSQISPDVQLRRADIDRYERSLKRRRWLGLLLVPVAAACAAGAFVWMRHDQKLPRDVEQEPNNTPVEANLLGNDHLVRGHIGKCISPEESDRDFYHFRVPKGPYVLHVDLTGVPLIDLKLEVFDPVGKKLAEADELGPGESEDLPNIRLDDAGEYFIGVREVWVAGKPATENETDWYTLNARFQPLQPTEESEPDDVPAQALPLPLPSEGPMRGFAGRANDVDYYYLRGEGGGTISGSVSAVDGVDLRVVVLPSGTQVGPPMPDKLLPAGTRIFDGGGAGVAETFDGVAWPAGTASPLVVVERKDGKPDASGRWHGLVGLDVPYSLNVRQNPTAKTR